MMLAWKYLEREQKKLVKVNFEHVPNLFKKKTTTTKNKNWAKVSKKAKQKRTPGEHVFK